jgi:hypothetical protein
MDGEAKKRRCEGDGAGLQGRSVEAGRETPERRPGRTSTGESTVLRLLPCSNEDGIPLLYSPPAGPRPFAGTADGRDNKPRPRPRDDGQYAESSFGGPKAVLAYLARYTHRIAISNSRLLAVDNRGVTFKVKDYRIEGPGRYTTMTLATHEFIKRFLMHVCCPRACIASAITGCSPAATAPPTSPGCANCWVCQRPRRRTAPAMNRQRPRRRTSRVRAAVDGCVSSRSSSPAPCRTTAPRRAPS